jgi:predicted CXXCH cytochrome family protein
MKKFALILLAIAILGVLMTGTALADFGPHGGYGQDTDACAACHRAHTAFSNAQWSDGTNNHSALLVGTATTMSEFCYACHGDTAPGASTNVQSGRYDSGPSGNSGSPLPTTNGGIAVAYVTNSSYDATLNGGGFANIGPVGASHAVVSQHGMDLGSGTAPMWGSGSSVPTGKNLTCTDCHDPHGSSNYRLLKDTLVNGQGTNASVGGYDSNGDPTPFVISAEEGYPQAGWQKGAAGAAQMAVYKPDYTTPEWRSTGNVKSISQWCAGCHTQYATKTSAYNYGSYIGGGSGAGSSNTFHRHPVDTSLVNGMPGNGNGTLPTNVLLDQTNLPLEHTGGSTRTDALTYTDTMGCLTCHFAHGSSASMDGGTGWAQSGIDSNGKPILLAQTVGGGTQPNLTASLLRTNGRGVCERCHNK